MLSIKHIPIQDVFLQQQLNYLEYLPFSPICMWLWVYGSKKFFVLQVPKIEWPDKILMVHSRLKVSACTYQKMCNYRNSFIPLHAWREVEKCGEFFTDMWIMVVLFYPDISKCKILHFEVLKFFCLKLPNSSRKSIKKIFTF